VFGLPARAPDAGAVFLTAGSSLRPNEARVADRTRAVCAQALTVVHLMASSLRVDRSLATAVRYAAKHAGGAASEELERIEWAVRLRHFGSVDEGLVAFADAVGKVGPDFKRALLTLQGAEAEATREGLERRLDRAYDIVVRADERRREGLASTLERPFQVLFGLGIVLPLVMAALVPMLEVGAGGVGLVPLALLLLVAVPAATLACASKILARNFLGAPVTKLDGRWAFVAGLAAPVCAFVAVGLSTLFPGALGLPGPYLVAAAIASGGVIAGILLLRRGGAREAGASAIGEGLADLLHAVGTKMAAGRSAEYALLEAVEPIKATPLGERLRGVLFDVIVGRRSLMDAIERDAEVRDAPRVFPALRLLASAAARDTEAAGRVVLHLSEFERLRADAAESLRSKCRAVVENTRMTVVVFAPMILGVTAGMFGLLSSVGMSFVPGAHGTGDLSSESFAVLAAVYLALEVALADWFGARMGSDQPISAFARAMARDIPLAGLLFAGALAGSSLLF